METKPSKVAIEAWFDVIKYLMRADIALQQIIIPARVYESNLDYEEGKQFFIEPKVIYRNSSIEDLNDYVYWQVKKHCKELENYDIALSTNVMLLRFGQPPHLAQLDIIDCKPVLHPSELEPYKLRYNILKTQNSYHLYPKLCFTGTNGGHAIIDPDWAMKFIRVTESETKGEITKYDDSTQIP